MIPILSTFTQGVQPFRAFIFRVSIELGTPFHEAGVTTKDLEVIIHRKSWQEVEERICEVTSLQDLSFPALRLPAIRRSLRRTNDVNQ